MISDVLKLCDKRIIGHFLCLTCLTSPWHGTVTYDYDSQVGILDSIINHYILISFDRQASALVNQVTIAACLWYT